MSEYLAQLLRNTNSRVWPAVPQPTEGIDSLRAAVEALKVRAETQGREVGDVLDSTVTVRDLIKLGVLTADGIHNVTEVEDELPAGSGGDMVYHDGSDWVALAEGTEGQLLYQGASSAPDWVWGGFRYLEQETAATAATLEFTDLDQNSDHLFVIRKLLPATDGDAFWAKTSASSGGTPTYDESAGNYEYFGVVGASNNSSPTANNSTGDTKVVLGTAVGSVDALETGVNGWLLLQNPGDSAEATYLEASVQYNNNAANVGLVHTSAARQSVAVVQAIQFEFSTGDITSGTIEHWLRRVQ